MKAAQGSGYGDPNDVLTVESGIPVPTLMDAVPDDKERKTSMIIRTLSVALAPGDCRVMSGMTRKFQGPPSFPYIPGGDCSGVIVELPDDYEEAYFKVGDYVSVRFNEVPRGALAEYAVVSMNVCDKVPASTSGAASTISPDEAAALASASPATAIGDAICQPGERILVLGANGGQGAHFCQHARRMGAACIVGVSDDPQRLLSAPIGCDEAIDYTKDDIWTLPKFHAEPFDTIMDFASGGWPKLVEQSKSAVNGRGMIVKPAVDGGRYLTTTPDQPTFEIHSYWQLLCIFAFPALYRAISTRTWATKTLPKYTMAMMGLPSKRDVITRTLSLANEGKLKAVIDPVGPFPFTTAGVRDAFHRQSSRHAKGKVVIHVADL
eukprot:CAMPEP_0119563174 /NCGR_PEP_ID=MMETSP1352-20130426/22630_1 /TAXON_ID=265584 /ORGANISM="Stauroneis constricta, Strain CCMP1120" /LENGTH=378 /DNA_ID=CAMNT_0007611719 /DNA_START=133 /DNA_END=1269 /DNA_ORIENTATION=+